MKSLEELYEIARVFGGIPVLSCTPGSPAHLAGIRYGDVLVRMNGQQTRDITGYVEAQDSAFGPVPVTVVRDGRELELTMELGLATPSEPDATEVLEHIVERRLFSPPRAQPPTRLC